MKTINTKYKIWNNGKLVPAYTRKPKNPAAIRLTCTTAEERKLGIRWYIPN